MISTARRILRGWLPWLVFQELRQRGSRWLGGGAGFRI